MISECVITVVADLGLPKYEKPDKVKQALPLQKFIKSSKSELLHSLICRAGDEAISIHKKNSYDKRTDINY